ncbi:MAG TPA: ATP-binding protein [Acidimicrobiales bacterium]
MTEAAELGAGDRVELSFPARGDLIVLARLVTSVVSARAGFDIEELEDLRLAVGELCLLTLQGSDGEQGDLRLELTVLSEAIGVVCTLAGAGAGAGAGASAASVVSTNGDETAQLSEQILDALVDDHGRERQDGSVRAWLRKRRGGHAA